MPGDFGLPETEVVGQMTHFWRLRVRLPERNGQPCRVIARGTMNSIWIEFADGVSHIVSRFAVRRLPERKPHAPR